MPIHIDVRTSELFFNAVASNNLAQLQVLAHMHGHLYLNFAQDNDGNSLLHIAAENGNYPICEYLLNNQVVSSIINNEHNTPYTLIAEQDDALLALFLQHNAEIIATYNPHTDSFILENIGNHEAHEALIVNFENGENDVESNPDSCLSDDFDDHDQPILGALG